MDLNETLDGASVPEHAGYDRHYETAAYEVSQAANRYVLITTLSILLMMTFLS